MAYKPLPWPLNTLSGLLGTSKLVHVQRMGLRGMMSPWRLSSRLNRTDAKAYLVCRRRVAAYSAYLDALGPRKAGDRPLKPPRLGSTVLEKLAAEFQHSPHLRAHYLE